MSGVCFALSLQILLTLPEMVHLYQVYLHPLLDILSYCSAGEFASSVISINCTCFAVDLPSVPLLLKA